MLNHTKKIKIKYNREATALLSALNGKYTKEILKNTKEKSGSRIFHILAQKQFCTISNRVGCIPQVLTLLLTPILT